MLDFHALNDLSSRHLVIVRNLLSHVCDCVPWCARFDSTAYPTSCKRACIVSEARVPVCQVAHRGQQIFARSSCVQNSVPLGAAPQLDGAPHRVGRRVGRARVAFQRARQTRCAAAARSSTVATEARAAAPAAPGAATAASARSIGRAAARATCEHARPRSEGRTRARPPLANRHLVGCRCKCGGARDDRAFRTAQAADASRRCASRTSTASSARRPGTAHRRQCGTGDRAISRA